MQKPFDPQSYLKKLAKALHRGTVSRRVFLKAAAGMGLTAAAVFQLLHPFGIVHAGQTDPDAVLKQLQNELEMAQRELDAAIAKYNAEVKKMEAEEAAAGPMNDQENENVFLRLKYPAGNSPNVFQTGWIFGAECLLRPADDDDDPIDASDDVKWSGSGKFSPAKGNMSRPRFSSLGANTIVLSIIYKGNKITKTIKVNVVSSSGYASVGSLAKCTSDAHGCPACPHSVIGPVTQGSPNVLVNGKPAARMGDAGVHAACCGPNTFKIAQGDPKVLINGKPAAKSGCKTIHCGGTGALL